MKKLNILLLSALAAVSGSALAMGGTVERIFIWMLTIKKRSQRWSATTAW